MADETRQQPVAIRVTRPYPSADEFLEHELETLSRTSITLIGAQPRPKGVILRFEVALTGGAQLLRGEGRVMEFKENALGHQAGLVLRFTRLDTKSKALVDRAAGIREARARAALQAAMGEESFPPPSVPPSSIGPQSIGPMSLAQPPPPSSDHVISVPPEAMVLPAFNGAPRPEAPEDVPPPRDAAPAAAFDFGADAHEEATASPNLYGSRESAAPAPVRHAAVSAAPPAAAPASHAGSHAAVERDPFLARLRERARELSPDRINRLLRR